MAITIVTGEIDSGKTAWLKSRAGAEGVVSWLSLKAVSDGEFLGYDLQMFPSGATLPLARIIPPSESAFNWFQFRRFRFNPEAFSEAQSFFDKSSEPNITFILDEVGPLELEGRGFAPLLESILKTGAPLTLSIRPLLVDEIQRQFSFSADEIMRLPG